MSENMITMPAINQLPKNTMRNTQEMIFGFQLYDVCLIDLNTVEKNGFSMNSSLPKYFLPLMKHHIVYQRLWISLSHYKLLSAHAALCCVKIYLNHTASKWQILNRFTCLEKQIKINIHVLMMSLTSQTTNENVIPLYVYLKAFCLYQSILLDKSLILYDTYSVCFPWNCNNFQVVKENAGCVDICEIYANLCAFTDNIKCHQSSLFDFYIHILLVVTEIIQKVYSFWNGIQFIQLPMNYRYGKLKNHDIINWIHSSCVFLTNHTGFILLHVCYFFPCITTFGLSDHLLTDTLFCLLRILCLTQFPFCLMFHYCVGELPMRSAIFNFDFCLLACLPITVMKLSNTTYVIFMLIEVLVFKWNAGTHAIQKPLLSCSKMYKSLLTNKTVISQFNPPRLYSRKKFCMHQNVKKLISLKLKLGSIRHKVLPVKHLSMCYIKGNLYSRNISSHTQRENLVEGIKNDLISYVIYVQVEIPSFEYCTEEILISTLESQGCSISCQYRSHYHRTLHEIIVNDINYPLPFSSERIGYNNYPDTPQNKIYYSIDALGVCEKTIHKTFLPCNFSHCISKLVPCFITSDEQKFDVEIVSDKRHAVIYDVTSEYRATNNQQVKKEMGNLLQGNTATGFVATSPPLAKSSTTNSHKHLPPNIQVVSQTKLNTRPGNVTADLQSDADQHLTSNVVGATGYTIDRLPDVPATLHQYYGTDFGAEKPLSKEEKRKDVQVVPKEKDVDSILESHHKDEASSKKKLSSELQATAKPSAKPRTSANVDRPPRFPRKACVVYKNEQYSLDPKLLSLPRATKYLVKVRTEISPGRFMAKLELHCASEDERLPNLDVTATTSNEQIVPVRERKHFRSNIDKTGYVIFSSDLESFSGHIQYPLPNKRATASRIGYGGNAIVFVVFHAGKEFAVKKTVYRSKEISVHSQLCHPNIINLEAVLVGEKHERHRDKYYVYCFMQKMDINFRNVLSTKDHGCLKHLKMKLVEKRDQWETVLLNAKHVLRSVLKALDYMHGQGLVHRDVKASNILIKTTCQCSEVLYCSCQHKFIVQLGDFDSSATVPGYQLHLEEHQMIRYASVLPLGTMGYRAPEVSMHLVLSGPYEVLYTTGVDIWSFGCLLLAIFIGKSGPLKQRGEASLLLSAQDHLYSQELYHKIIKISELRKYYANVPGACDLAEKCLQVQPHCRPTAKELLQLDFFR